ncbi:hypothetical protein [Enterococcus phoeniculicola]|jgi:hypothetical protein|uniref:Uncharacterized protein n=1 Tax=Enterococcus phoeniculicola ATCC BAA-412 TaxID=1158610 RepID=R3W2C0_9ENTE|nr:hypothetical protein [Enterococcus phoeniculicola]EOL41812.1 hypothetical protein UC3_03377 [Enterococcus phoeniculicola ATCC BAA-412]EOT78694.1 hypothetical protein I589_00199 [Enterococcus phoeniculicola ATCC BAA-412]
MADLLDFFSLTTTILFWIDETHVEGIQMLENSIVIHSGANMKINLNEAAKRTIKKK